MAMEKKMSSKSAPAAKAPEAKEKQKPTCWIKGCKKVEAGQSTETSYAEGTRKVKGDWETGLLAGLFLNIKAPNEYLPNGEISLGTKLQNDLQIEKGTIIEIPLHKLAEALGIKFITNDKGEVAVESAE
jgi:hypothetical protein